MSANELKDALSQPVFWLAAMLVCASFTYWLGRRHGMAARPAPAEAAVEIESAPVAAEIPSYRMNELLTLVELGILTPEEFEQEKGKLYASGTA